MHTHVLPDMPRCRIVVICAAQQLAASYMSHIALLKDHFFIAAVHAAYTHTYYDTYIRPPQTQ
jgi:hypothetical protein